MTTVGDGTEAPDHGPHGIEIRRADVQRAALPVRRGDLLHHFLVHVLGDQGLKRPSRGHRVGTKRPNIASLLVHVVRLELRGDDLQDIVVLRPEERKRRHQRPCANPGDYGELRPISSFRPA
jgi:hypothetical protein